MLERTAEPLGGDQHRLVGKGAAAEEPAQARAGGGCLVDHPGRPLRHAVPLRLERGLDRGREVRAPGAQRGPVDGHVESRGVPWRSASTSSAAAWTRRPRSSPRRRRAREACFVERPETAAERSRPPTPRQWLTPTSAASSRHITCWAPVPDAATMPTWPWRTALAAEGGDAADDGGAAVGAHDQDVRGRGGVLEPDLVLDGHVVREEHHGDAAVDRVERLDGGVLSGHRDQARLASEAAIAPPSVRRGGASPKPPACAPADFSSASAVSRAARPAASPRRRRGWRPRGRWGRLGRDGEAHRGDHLGVELGRHGDLGRLDAGGGGHGS